MSTATHPERDTHETMVVEVELRGLAEQIRWNPDGVEASDAVLSRLGQVDGDLLDPVVFLAAVRSSFGEHVAVHFER